MKKFTLGILIFSVLLNLAFIGGFFYFYVNSDTILIRSGRVSNDTIIAEGKNIIIEDAAILHGDITLGKGDITLGKQVQVIGTLHVQEGDVTIGDEAVVQGNIQIDEGNLLLGNKSRVEGNLLLGNKSRVEGNVLIHKGELQKNSRANISGTFPPIFRTTDYPPVLDYFEVLPPEHKNNVGYIFLTKSSNTLIRDENVTQPDQYFDGVYYYENNELKSVPLSDSKTAQLLFDNAAKFFRGLPERRLGPFGVGATTKDFAMNGQKADIYMPSNGSDYVFIHEMGHVQDFSYDFSDFHQPAYPFISQGVALNSYGATHPGEDFAEAYKYYALNPSYFEELIQQNPERQQKYDFLKQYVFKGKEYW